MSLKRSMYKQPVECLFPPLIKLLTGLFRLAPRYPSEHETFRTNCELVCNLSKVPKELFKKRISELWAYKIVIY